MDLRAYERHKFALAEILRSAAGIAASNREKLRERTRALAERLAADRFNLVVVGRFNRGKTSLMNAIMGTDRLPTGVVPITSVITSVTYGSKEEAILKYENSFLHQSVPIETLPQFITQAGNPGNVRRIRAAEIRLPAEVLRSGFYFIDTPGLGSAIAENTITTEAFLPEADALLLVTGYESPLSDEELKVLKIACSSRRKIFVAINKHDTVFPPDRERIFAFVSNSLQDAFFQFVPELFSISALEGLKAKQRHDETLLAQSGIERLEDSLVRFLLEEKGERFLLSMCHRIADLLRESPAVPETGVLLDRLNDLGKIFGRGESIDRTTRLSSTQNAFNLHRVASCEICTYVREQVWNFICKYQYDLIASSSTQKEFAARNGFCPFHTWEYEAVASSYGICNAYPELLAALAARLQAIAANANDRDHLTHELDTLQSSPANCPLCNERDKAEKSAVIRTAGKMMDKARVVVPELCFPHLQLIVRKIDDPNAVRTCIERHAELLERISDDLRRHALRVDGTRRDLITDEEAAAARRAMMALVGARDVNFDLVSRPSRSQR